MVFLFLSPKSFGGGENDHPDDQDGQALSTFGLKIFLLSLIMLFGATLVGYIVTRIQASGSWEGYQIPGFDLGIAISTATLVLTSFCLHRAMVNAGQNRQASLQKNLWFSALLATGFLVSQVHNWLLLVDFHGGLMTERNLALFLFYAMTFIHAIHVLAGFVPLAIVIRKSRRHTYRPGHLTGLWNCVLYWHFLDIVWVLIAILLWIG